MRVQSPRLVDRRVKLIILLTVAVVGVQSYASNVQVSTITYEAQYGLHYDVTSSFTALDQGFSTVAVSQIASLQPCLWANGTTCNTTLTLPDLQYSLALILNTPPSLLTTYTLTVLWNQIGGSQTQMGQLTLSVSATALAGQQMTFQIDTGTSSFSTPLSIDVTVA